MKKLLHGTLIKHKNNNSVKLCKLGGVWVESRTWGSFGGDKLFLCALFGFGLWGGCWADGGVWVDSRMLGSNGMKSDMHLWVGDKRGEDLAFYNFTLLLIVMILNIYKLLVIIQNITWGRSGMYGECDVGDPCTPLFSRAPSEECLLYLLHKLDMRDSFSQNIQTNYRKQENHLSST